MKKLQNAIAKSKSTSLQEAESKASLEKQLKQAQRDMLKWLESMRKGFSGLESEVKKGNVDTDIISDEMENALFGISTLKNLISKYDGISIKLVVL